MSRAGSTLTGHANRDAPTPTHAAVVHASGQPLSVEELQLRPVGRGELGVEIRVVGVCHSDLHLVAGDWPVDEILVGGHEASGVVVDVGDGVEDVNVGDHVVLSWFVACRRCQNCLSGRAWLCTNTNAVANRLPDGSTATTTADGDPVWPFLGLGAFSERVVIPSTAAVVVPDELPFEIGALIGCSVTTGIGAVTQTAKVPYGASAVVFGCGGIGQSIILGLQLAGAEPIIAIDLDRDRLEQADRLGATVLLDGAEPDLVDVVRELTSGGADYVFEAIGKPSTIEQCPPMLRAGGVAVLAGMTAIGARASIDPFDLADQGKSILGCNYGSSVPAVDFPRIARLYLTGRLPLDALIGRTRPLVEVNDALADLSAAAGLRTVLIP